MTQTPLPPSTPTQYLGSREWLRDALERYVVNWNGIVVVDAMTQNQEGVREAVRNLPPGTEVVLVLPHMARNESVTSYEREVHLTDALAVQRCRVRCRVYCVRKAPSE